MRFTIGETCFLNRTATINLESPPFIEDGRTMVPFRAIAEGLGASVGWDEASNSVYFTRDKIALFLPVGVSLPDEMGTPVIIDGRTFVPLRYVSEVFSATIRWDSIERSVYIY
jgi:hypothetical protein